MPRTLSSSRTELARLLHRESRPVYVLDEEHRLVFLNKACEAWLGQPEEKLIGQLCLYAAQGSAAKSPDGLPGLAPPPEVAAGERRTGPVYGGDATRGAVARESEFVPLRDERGEYQGVLVLVGPEAAVGQTKPLPLAEDEPTAEQLHRQLLELAARRSRRLRLERIVGESPAMRRVRAQIQLAAQSPTHALVTGPRGSGRRFAAEAIGHARRPHDPAGVAPLSSWLLDAELVQGAVAAAVRRADHDRSALGTILLLEADQLPADAQRELAGFLALPECPISVIGTSDRPLLELAAEGKFLPALASALSALVIELPALAARREDLPLVAQQLVEEINARGGPQRSGFSPEALDLLAAHSWPGNLDELAEMVRAAHAAAKRPLIGPADLPEVLHLAQQAAAVLPKPPVAIVLDEVLADAERELLRRALEQAKGNRSKAATLLGITRPRLLRRLEQLGLIPRSAKAKPPESAAKKPKERRRKVEPATGDETRLAPEDFIEDA